MDASSGTSFLVPDMGFLMIARLSRLSPVLAFLAVIWVVVRSRNGPIVTGYGSPEARLAQLAQLQQQGVITRAEYDTRRAAILDSI
jgi:Short C-terminal domain